MTAAEAAAAKQYTTDLAKRLKEVLRDKRLPRTAATREYGLLMKQADRDTLLQGRKPQDVLKESVEAFRALWTPNSSSDMEAEEDKPLLQSVDRLNFAMGLLVRRDACSETRSKRLRHYPALVELCFTLNMHELYLDVLTEDTFFSRPLYFIDSIIEGFTLLIWAVSDLATVFQGSSGESNDINDDPAPSTRSIMIDFAVRRMAPRLWECLWDNRQHLKAHRLHDHYYVLEDHEGAGEPVEFLLCAYAILVISSCNTFDFVLGTKYLHLLFDFLISPHVTWSSGSLDHILPVHKLLSMLRERFFEDDRILQDAVVSAAILQGVGADDFISSFNRKLRHRPAALVIGDDLFVHEEFLLSESLHPYIFKHGVHRTFYECVQSLHRSDEAVNEKLVAIQKFHSLTAELVNGIISALKEGHSDIEIFLSGEDFMRGCSLEFEFLCETKCRFLTDPAYSCTNRESQALRTQRSAIDILVEENQNLVRFIGTLQRDSAHLPAIRTFLEAARGAARAIWWPTHRALLSARNDMAAEHGPTEIDALAEVWIVLAVALGLNPKKEPMKYEKLANQRCSWRLCPYHSVNVDESVKLKACQGCGKVRYCGRVCQRMDWSGGHKQQCRIAK
ncbi:hypothetical protein PENSPDRAFT_759749 [Peniophora sp. CONT]|nr:hypothetical protein PENSPDRAFT_759749 [Peniophora sp. CONT]